MGGRVWVCWAWLFSLGSLGSNCLQFGLLNSESRARCSGTSGSGQGFRLTLVWMGPGGRAPVPVGPKRTRRKIRGFEPIGAGKSTKTGGKRTRSHRQVGRFCRVQPHQDLEGRHLSYPHVLCFLPGPGTVAWHVPGCSRPSTAYTTGPAVRPTPPFLRLEGSRFMSPTGGGRTAAFSTCCIDWPGSHWR